MQARKTPSDLRGQIGTGGSFSTSALTVGVHTVAASVTDSGGAPGSDTITVTVNETSPVDTTLEFRVVDGNDDGEERASGNRKTPLRLIPRSQSHSSSVVSSMVFSISTPALFTSTSSEPKQSTVKATRARCRPGAFNKNLLSRSADAGSRQKKRRATGHKGWTGAIESPEGEPIAKKSITLNADHINTTVCGEAGHSGDGVRRRRNHRAHEHTVRIRDD